MGIEREELVNQARARVDFCKREHPILPPCKAINCQFARAVIEMAEEMDQMERMLADPPDSALRIATLEQQVAEQATEIRVVRRDCARMLRRGQMACERQGWEKGESTESWYHAAGQLAGLLEIANKAENETGAEATNV